MKNYLSRPPRKEKLEYFEQPCKKQNDISHVCVPLLQCNHSVFVSSSFHPSQPSGPFICTGKNRSCGSLKQQKQCLETLGAAGALSNFPLAELWSTQKIVVQSQSQAQSFDSTSRTDIRRMTAYASKTVQMTEFLREIFCCSNRKLVFPP